MSTSNEGDEQPDFYTEQLSDAENIAGLSEDQRSAVRGYLTELLFPHIVLDSTRGTLPAWLVGVFPASDIQNINGIDFIINILNARDDFVSVPVQVKSSRRGVQEYVNRYPYFASKVITCVLNERTDPASFQDSILSQLLEIHTQGFAFDNFLAEVDNGNVKAESIARYRGKRRQVADDLRKLMKFLR